MSTQNSYPRSAQQCNRICSNCKKACCRKTWQTNSRRWRSYPRNCARKSRSSRPIGGEAVLYIVCMAISTSPTKARPKKQAKARLVSSRTVYRGPVFWVTTDHVIEPGGIKIRRDLIHHSGSVVVLAVDDST